MACYKFYYHKYRLYTVSEIIRTESTRINMAVLDVSTTVVDGKGLMQCFSTAGPPPGTGPWHQFYRAARDTPGIDN